jgi:RHS repeat-associated protein
MKKVYVGFIVAILCIGAGFQVEFLAGLLENHLEELFMDQSIDSSRHFTLRDSVLGSDTYYGYTETPAHQPLEVHQSDDPRFEYMAVSPYYKVFFKGTTVKMSIQDAWIEFDLVDNGLGRLQNARSVAAHNSLSIADVFESIDVVYTMDTSLVEEMVVLKSSKDVSRFIQKISWDRITPEFQKDGSILFLNEDKKILKILPPFMKDAQGAVSTDVHYELLEGRTGYELHKVIDEEGLQWLKQAAYPVVIDPSMQTFEDAWQSSGLTPYGQYFRNLREYVNPVTGYLTITQTDLVIPGRGLDLVISRVYQTPAVFYGSDPYDYEAPPVDVGKGWQLNFPYVGTKYLHLWGGTVYKIAWSGNTFENHEGIHFTLVKNGDNTYTLTSANGIVYSFNTSGDITSIKDVDLNTITFTYSSGVLTSISDTTGRTVSLTYSSNRLQKITYNSAELEYSYDGNGCLQWMDDFLDRRTSYSYSSGYNNWLLSQITYPTTGYTTYTYNRFTDSGYYKYYVTSQKVYETSQVRHAAFSFTGSFDAITASSVTVKNESDTTKGSYHFTMSNGLITERVVKNASTVTIRKFSFTYNASDEVTEEKVYNNGSTLSYTKYYNYDNWGNLVYYKNGEGHEQLFSYSNTDTSGFFIDNTGTIIKTFTNAFANSSVPSSVHTVLLGTAEKQDATYVREAYITYDSEAHPTQVKNSFGNTTTWLTYSGTFNEKTSDTSFSIDLTGHTVTGNAALTITGLPSDDTYQETHSRNCPIGGKMCEWDQDTWSDEYYDVYWESWGYNGWLSIGPFTHYPGTLGYQSYTVTPPECSGPWCPTRQSVTISVTTNWKAYPVQVQYKINSSDWATIADDLEDSTAKTAVTDLVSNSSNTLYFSESSAKDTKFSWYLYVPVDNTPTTYTTSMAYDTYGNITSITDAESNAISFTYSSSYSYAYLTEISAAVGTDTITTKATYDSARGWITSIQEPKGVDAGSGYDALYTYDVLGRVTKKEFPLLSGQSQRSYLEAVYDDTNRTVTIIDQLRHYIVQHFDKLGRKTHTKWYTGTYGSGTLYATESYAYRYDNLLYTVTDPGNDTYTYSYDFLGRQTQISFPDSSSKTYSYDDTNHKITLTDGRGYDTVYWYDWLSRLEKVEEEYQTDTFATTTYNYNEIGQLTSFTDAESHTTSYTYASTFGLTKTTFADAEYEEYVYDNVGNVATFTDCKGNDTTFTYDDIYRLTQIQYEDLSTVDFTYDLNSNRTQMEDDAPSANDYVEYTYDYWNRLTTEKRHISTSTYEVAYQYDVANRLTALTYPDDMDILYSYDDLNRITEIKRYVDGSNDEILMDGVQYDVENLLTQFDYGNDLQATFSYDANDRILTIDLKDGATSYIDLDFTYNNNSSLTQLVNGWRDTSSTWHSETESYSYDGLDRLTSASCTSWSHTYTYDKVGNRTGKDSVTYTVNTVNEVTALSDGTSFTYDDNGNRTQKTKGSDTWDYTYDYANRLTEVEENSATIGEYVYDGNGRRLQATEDSVTTTSIYGGSNLMYEENTTGVAAYIYGPTGKIAKRTTINQQSDTYFYHKDHLGSTRLVTDDSKTIVSAITYHPFGKPSIEEGSEEYSFTGSKMSSSNLFYLGSRYYDSELGRFISRDLRTGTLLNPQTLNRYTYCVNNPLGYKDTQGLSGESINEDCECLDKVETELTSLENLGNAIDYAQEELDYAYEALEKGGYEEFRQECLDFLNDMGWQVPALLDDERDVDKESLLVNGGLEVATLPEIFSYVSYAMLAIQLGIVSHCIIRLWQYKMHLKTVIKNEALLADLAPKREKLIEDITKKCSCTFQSSSSSSTSSSDESSDELPDDIGIV